MVQKQFTHSYPNDLSKFLKKRITSNLKDLAKQHLNALIVDHEKAS